MNELVNDGIKLLKLEINTGFINGLPKKWLAFCQSLRNTNHVKESELASLFGKVKYEENLINSIYDTNKKKTLVPATPLSTALFSTSIVQDSQNSPDDEEDTRSSQEYMNDLEEEYQARALLAKSKRFFKKDFEAKYNKVKAKLALLSSSTSAPSSSSGKNKGLIAESYDWDDKEVSSDDNDVTIVKALMALADEKEFLLAKKVSEMCISEQIPTQKKKILGIDQLTEDTSSFGLKDPVFVKSSADDSEVSITGSIKPKLSEAEDSTMSKHDTAVDYDSVDESSVCSTPLSPLEKLTGANKKKKKKRKNNTKNGAEPISGPKTIKSILKSKSTFKAETLKGIIINEPSSALARGNKSSSVFKTNSAPTGKLKDVKIEDDPPLAIVMKELNELKLHISKNKSSYFRNNNSQQVPSNAHQNKYKTQFKMNYELC
ncbi:hypothetical protein Tco_0669936 [Tanacetum coccineum]